jgi:intracellular sulfur oxidation DsrE/DsrF family protein
MSRTFRTALHRLATLAFVFPALCSLAAEYPPGAMLGPVIKDYGPVVALPEGAYAMDNEKTYKVVKDISTASDQPGELNRNFDSVARLLNMQARAGMPNNGMEVAVVIHGTAVRDLLTDAAYRDRFGMANPNTGLIDALSNAGVAIYLCSQTAAARGFDPKNMNPNVTLALSAMGAHVRLQDEGYRLIPF